MQKRSSMPQGPPRTQTAVGLLGAHRVIPTQKIDAPLLRNKVSVSADFTDAERVVLLHALDLSRQRELDILNLRSSGS